MTKIKTPVVGTLKERKAAKEAIQKACQEKAIALSEDRKRRGLLRKEAQATKKEEGAAEGNKSHKPVMPTGIPYPSNSPEYRKAYNRLRNQKTPKDK